MASLWDKPADLPDPWRLLSDDVVIWSNPTWRTALPQMWPIPIYFLIISLARIILHFGLFIPWARLMLPRKKNPQFVTAPECPHPNLERSFRRDPKLSAEELKSLVKSTELEPDRIAEWFRRMRAAVGANKAQTKFTESAWKFLYYGSSFIYGVMVITSKWWLSNTRRAYWYEFPNPLDKDVEDYYAVTFAFYMHMLVSLVWFEERKKDYWQMFAHHWITLALIFGSWMVGFSRIGCILLVLHDSADPWLEIAKIFSYAQWQRTCDALFAVFALVFGVTRLYLYPAYCCLPALIETIPLHDSVVAYLGFNALLFSLLGLNVFWFSIVVRMAYTLLFDPKWSRRDDRSESDVPSDEDTSKPTHSAQPLKTQTDADSEVRRRR